MPGVDINYFIRQANKLTEKIEQRKKELAEEVMEVKAGEGRVAITISLMQEVKAIKILDKSIIDPNDLAMLEDLLTAAVNAANTQSHERMTAELTKVSGGMKIPGLT
jgi:DNA-binding YbaB/EbfC family protein